MTKQHEVVQDLKRYAHSKHDKPYHPEPAQPDCPLVPLLIAVPDGSNGEIIEEILWRLGDPAWEPKGVAGRLCQDLGLPSDMEREVEEQINYALQSFKGWRDLGGQKLVRMQVFVRRGFQALRDEVTWDINNPVSSSHAYADQVCRQLRLDLPWFEAINKYVQMRLEEYVQDLTSYPSEVHLLSGTGSCRRDDSQPAELLPKIEPYDEARDLEAVRLKARAERLARRQAPHMHQQGQQQQQAMQDQQQQPMLQGQER